MVDKGVVVRPAATSWGAVLGGWVATIGASVRRETDPRAGTPTTSNCCDALIYVASARMRADRSA